MPPGRAPPSGVAGLSLLNFPSMLQSCGRLSIRQLLSFKLVFSPSFTLPRWKCQSLSKLATDLACWPNAFKVNNATIKDRQNTLAAFCEKALLNDITGLFRITVNWTLNYSYSFKICFTKYFMIL